MKSKEIVGLIILVVVVSGLTYSYMEYQEKERQRQAYEAWIKEIEAKRQAWKDEVAYYENLDPNMYVINGPYEYGNWMLYLDFYGDIPLEDGGIGEIRNVTSTELRTEIDEWGLLSQPVGSVPVARSPGWVPDCCINIDRSEGVIFIRRLYNEKIDEHPFEGTILVCWRP